ncbi:MAG TPA: hypothetical protein VLY45_06720 [Nitrospiria bacterium]|nr:hypothetical protein [Nitrospiria bacterium]
MNRAVRFAILVSAVIGLAVAVGLLPPIRQDPAYHRLADQRSLWGIQNAADTGSNLAILAAGTAGLLQLWRSRRPGTSASLSAAAGRWVYWRLYAASLLAAIGSIYYHLSPDTPRLLWDRLPLALLLASFLAMLITERIGAGPGLLAGPPLVLLAVGSVLYWYAGELHGEGDLRPYVFVQGAVLVLSPLLLVMGESTFPGETVRWWGLLLLYALAKGCEQLDHQLFALGHVVSGHTLKHLLAAGAIFMTVRIRALRDATDPPAYDDRPFTGRI